MVFRYIFRLFSNNDEVIRRLSETYPIRRLARFIAGLIVRGKEITQDAGVKPEQIESLKNADLKGMAKRFTQVFKEDFSQLKEEVKDLKNSFPKKKQ